VQTQDGWINIGAANQANWKRLVEVIEKPELADDPRFTDNAARMKNLPVLIEILTACIRTRTTSDWLARLEAAGVPAGPVLSIGEMLADPQVLARQMVVEVEHSRLGRMKTLGPPVKFSATPGGVQRGAPQLGEHTREVLQEYGYSDAEIDGLAGNGDVIVL
jgi:crotonobetainyl-CoA:carnitine CoA-transferase CaiB-like acyl-CoA transferase